MLDVHDLHVFLNRKEILQGVDMRAQAGEVTAIVGQNGSGKTTLMRAMTQDLPYHGAIRLEGREINTMRGWELAVRRAVQSQTAGVAFPFTVLEVVRLGMMAGGETDRLDLPSDALALVGLSGFEGRFYQELSGGEQQRVQLARALVQVWDPNPDGVPHWLFLDEPVSSLDIGHQLEVMDILRSYATKGGGVIAVMHDLNLTAMFADHVVLLAKGRCLAAGPPSAVFTDVTLTEAYECPVRVNTTPEPGQTYVLPHAARISHD